MPGSLRGILGGYLFLRRASGNGKRESEGGCRQRLLDEKDTDLRKFLIAITVRTRYHDDRKSVEFWREVNELTVPEKTDGYSLGGR